MSLTFEKTMNDLKERPKPEFKGKKNQNWYKRIILVLKNKLGKTEEHICITD